MGTINREVITGLRTMVSNDMDQGFEKKLDKLHWPKITTELPMNTKQTEFVFNDTSHQMRYWGDGEREESQEKVVRYPMIAHKWQLTVKGYREDIEDSNLQPLRTRAESAGFAQATFFEQMAFGMLFDAFNTTADKNMFSHDGVSFFNKTHTDAPAGSISNIYGTIGATSNKWILTDASLMGPVLIGNRVNFEMQEANPVNGDGAFYNDELVWGVRGRYGFGFGKWWDSIASEEALTATTFNAAINQGMKLFDSDGVARNSSYNTLIVTPDNRLAAIDLLAAERNASGATNTSKESVAGHGITNLIVTPYLSAGRNSRIIPTTQVIL